MAMLERGKSSRSQDLFNGAPLGSSLLQVENLRTYLSLEEGFVRAVDGVSLAVNVAEIVGLVGESGCGKTMTALSILGLLPNEARLDGSILYRGTNLLTKPPRFMDGIRGKEISAVFQDPLTFLNPVMKIKKQVAEPLITHMRLSKSQAYVEAVKLLAKVGIGEPSVISEAYPYQLSGGMRQRVLLAIALAANPSLLIADEPFTALDVSIQDQLMRMLRELQSSLGFACLLITHDLGVAAELCDRIYVMYAGEIVETADTRSLFTQPSHPYTAALISAANVDDVVGDQFPSIPGTVPSLLNPPPGCRFHPRCPSAFEPCPNKRPQVTRPARDHEVRCWLYG